MLQETTVIRRHGHKEVRVTVTVFYTSCGDIALVSTKHDQDCDEASFMESKGVFHSALAWGSNFGCRVSKLESLWKR